MGLIAIGDVHGCPKTLDALLDALAPAPGDHLVFVGDYIDRGPDSKGVIDRLLALREEHPCTFLRGNHEALMIDYLDRGVLGLWRQNGGVHTLQSYANGQEVCIPEVHEQFIRSTKPYHDEADFLFVHAGLKPDRSVEENLRNADEQTLLWERSHLQAPRLAWEKTVVCGHTPHRAPINREKLIMIDTGCVYHTRAGLGRLTAVRLPERTFTTVDYVG